MTHFWGISIFAAAAATSVWCSVWKSESSVWKLYIDLVPFFKQFAFSNMEYLTGFWEYYSSPQFTHTAKIQYMLAVTIATVQGEDHTIWWGT